MIFTYLAFIKSNYKFLIFCTILLFLSYPGQTFFISIFTQSFSLEYSLNYTELGSLYSVATFLGALALPFISKKTDVIGIRAFIGLSGFLLILSCMILVFPSHSIILLGISMCLLRLAGQGLMIHASQSVIVKYFDSGSGKAMAITGLMSSVGLMIVPFGLVYFNQLLGWRHTWLIVAFSLIMGLFILDKMIDPTRFKNRNKLNPRDSVKIKKSSLSLRYLYFLCPIMLAVSFIFTGILFHQSALALEKGWSLTLISSCFSFFAITLTITSLIFGPVMDEIGPFKVLSYFLLPLLAALVLIIFGESTLVPPFFMALTGVSAALDIKLGTILWSRLYGLENFDYVKSRFESVRIIATGLSPLIMGYYLDRGVSVTTQAMYFTTILVFCILMALYLKKLLEAEATRL